MIARLAAAAAAALLLVACGDSSDGRYDAEVGQVRQAVEAGDRDAALASLDEIGEAAFLAHVEGEVSDEEIEELAVLLDHARAQVDAELPEPTTTTTTTTSTTAPPTTPPAPLFESDSDDDDDKPKRGNGRGRGGDDGDDDDD